MSSALVGLEPAPWTALFWLEWRLARNRVRAILRNPRRLLPWSLFLIVMLPTLFGRVAATLSPNRSSRRQDITAGDDAVARAVLVPILTAAIAVAPGLGLIAAGLLLLLGSRRSPLRFQSPADARFLIGSGLDSRTVMSWLALRSARRLVLVSAFYLAVFLISVPLFGTGAAGLSSLATAVIAAAWLSTGLSLTGFSASRRWPRQVRLVAMALVAVGVAALVMGAASYVLSPPDPGRQRLALATPPGGWFLSALGGSRLALLGLASLGLALVAFACGVARDCLPEIWQRSTRIFEARRSMLRGELFRRTSTAAHDEGRRAPRAGRTSGGWVPGGSLTLAWKEWLTLRRRPFGPWLVLLGLLGPIVLGAAASRTQGGTRVGLLSLAAGGALFLAILRMSMGLGPDLSNPLWWLSPVPLWRRLLLFIAVRTLLPWAPFLIFSATVALLTGWPWWGLPMVAALSFLALLISQAVSLTAYSLLPARSDLRLVQTLRIGLFYLSAAVIGAAALPGGRFRQPAAAVGGPLLVALLLLALMIWFSSRRIAGNGLAFAREESQ